jgi:GNAT superfamily N-acetyltransferase
VKLLRYAERADLRERRSELRGSFPVFMHHNASAPRFWRRLYVEYPAFQLCLLDEERNMLAAEAHAVPVAWDGTVDDLPSGWDDACERGMERGAHTALSALAIAVDERRRGEGLSSTMLDALRDAAREAGLVALIAPVRPTWKERYPLIPIERYMHWRRDDGQLFDPWLRVHERRGGEVLAAAPESMTIAAPALEWESWTGLHIPEDGSYVVPGALAPLEVRDGIGSHVEPNVWMVHRL